MLRPRLQIRDKEDVWRGREWWAPDGSSERRLERSFNMDIYGMVDLSLLSPEISLAPTQDYCKLCPLFVLLVVISAHWSFSVWADWISRKGRQDSLDDSSFGGRKFFPSSESSTLLGLWVSSGALLIKIVFVPVKQWASLQQILDCFPPILSLDWIDMLFKGVPKKSKHFTPISICNDPFYPHSAEMTLLSPDITSLLLHPGC